MDKSKEEETLDDDEQQELEDELYSLYDSPQNSEHEYQSHSEHVKKNIYKVSKVMFASSMIGVFCSKIIKRVGEIYETLNDK